MNFYKEIIYNKFGCLIKVNCYEIISVKQCHNLYGPSKIVYSPSNKINNVYVKEYKQHGLYHDLYHAARNIYYINGNKLLMAHYKYGILHNDNRPALIKWKFNNFFKEIIFYVDGKIHNKSNVAFIVFGQKNKIKYKIYCLYNNTLHNVSNNLQLRKYLLKYNII